MLTASELKSLLKTHGLRLTKRLGQHHLVDERLVRRIVERCELSSKDTVIEIGPGLGALTEFLAERAHRVIAVEVDRRICALLAERLGEARNVTVLCQDILDFSWDAVGEVTVVGAIPYRLSSPILSALCDARGTIRQAVLIIQEEVAQRLLAVPGTKAYGRLSILAQYGWEVSSLLTVPRSAFFPQPEVDSRCVHLKRRARPPAAVSDEPLFFGVVKAAFSHRRKTLVNCFTRDDRLRLDRPQAEALVRGLGLSPAARGETVSLEQFAALADAISRMRRIVA